MTGYEAMTQILDVNETLEELKKINVGDGPDLFVCKIADLLDSYRTVLIQEMKNTELDCFRRGREEDARS